MARLGIHTADTAGDMGVGKGHAGVDKAVHIRRLYLVIAEGVYGAVALIVGQKEEHVRTLN